MRSSHPPTERDLIVAYADVLKSVDGLPAGATGALAFGSEGVILVERKRVCWALASEMPRLTDILCAQETPPLPRRKMEDVFRRCQREHTPFGEALLASGMITENGLRTALSLHSGEAIARLAQGGAEPTQFSNHLRRGYDPRFAFTTAELLASFGARQSGARALVAEAQLGELRVPDTLSFAFLRGSEDALPVVIAVGRGCELRVAELLDVAVWASELFELSSMVDPATELAAASWCTRTGIVSWRVREVGYAAVCTTRAASSLLVNHLRDKFAAQRAATRELAEEVSR
jgi:hypothetical protein